MSKKVNIIIISILSFILLGVLVLNVSLALMQDSKSGSGIIQFKQHKLDISIKDHDSVVLTPEELTIGSTAQRIINITNPSNSTNCVFRIWLEFKVQWEEGGEYLLDTEYLNLSIENPNFSKTDNNQFYYNNVLTSVSGQNTLNLTLNFKVNENALTTYENKKYNLKLYVESLQANKEAVSVWENDYPASWYDGIENRLS